MVLWAAMTWDSGLQMKQLGIMVLGGLILAVVAFNFIQPYQQQRIVNFFRPDLSARNGATYNVIQALIALGSGGLQARGMAMAPRPSCAL